MRRGCYEEDPEEEEDPEQKANPDAMLTAVAVAVAVVGTMADAVVEVATGSEFVEPGSEAPALTRAASAMVLEAVAGDQPKGANEQVRLEVEVPGSGLEQVLVRVQMEQKEWLEQSWEVHWRQGRQGRQEQKEPQGQKPESLQKGWTSLKRSGWLIRTDRKHCQRVSWSAHGQAVE